MKHRILIGFVLFEFLILLFLFAYGQMSINGRMDEIVYKKTLVRNLMLTDFAIWTEARYTRHPSQADLFTPFQDFPSSIEHFPAGSILAPPDIIKSSAKN
jgi:hypothetical protein